VQHRVRPAPAQDLEAIVISSTAAHARGAVAIVLPDVPSLVEGPLADELYCRLEESAPGVEPVTVRPDEDAAFTLRDIEPFGRAALLHGDACIDAEVLAVAAAAQPGLAVLALGAESELQAQAVLELAVALSTSLASVVVIAETDGGELGEPGHGGSAIVYLGEVLAEALAGDDVLVADLPAPLGPPQAPAALPEIPPVLLQRAAAHSGHKLAVDYPADLT
jgi:hypothetical protein